MSRVVAAFAITVLAAAVVAGCLGGVENEVCKGVKSYSVTMDQMESVEKACDACVGVLKVSGQETTCLEQRNYLDTFNGRKDLKAGEVSYPNLFNREDDWAECNALKDDATKLRCGCCILKGKEYRFETAKGCYQITSTSYFKGTERTEPVEESTYFADGRCV